MYKYIILSGKTLCLQVLSHTQTWRHQSQWCTTSVLVIRTQTLKAAGQKCKCKITFTQMTVCLILLFEPLDRQFQQLLITCFSTMFFVQYQVSQSDPFHILP